MTESDGWILGCYTWGLEGHQECEWDLLAPPPSISLHQLGASKFSSVIHSSPYLGPWVIRLRHKEPGGKITQPDHCRSW